MKGAIEMMVYHSRPDALFIELSPGPFRGKWAIPGTLYFDEAAWGFVMVHLIIGRIYDYDDYSETDVPREQWKPIQQDLAKLRAKLDECECEEDVLVEFGLLYRDTVLNSRYDFAQFKSDLTTILDETQKWLIEALKTNEVVSILGL